MKLRVVTRERQGLQTDLRRVKVWTLRRVRISENKSRGRVEKKE